jgi:voltage-gated potassium channel
MRVLDRPADQRDRLAQELLDRLTPLMSALGIIFVLVILGEQLTRPGSWLSELLSVLGWVLWAAFAAEFAARAVVAPHTGRFLRRNWWQVAFIVLPFLRVLRLIRAARFLRTGRVLSGAVRGTRSTASVLRGRLGWLVSLWVITVLSVSQLLYAFSGFATFADALHATALGAVTGEPLEPDDAVARLAEVFLGMVSVVVFGTLAGTLGAYFLRSDERTGAAPGPAEAF